MKYFKMWKGCRHQESHGVHVGAGGGLGKSLSASFAVLDKRMTENVKSLQKQGPNILQKLGK
jgi:hypothetical protein